MIEINNFFNIFQQYGSIIDSAELLHEGIATARKLLNNVDTNWKQQEPRVTDLKDFILEIKWNRYIVIKNNVKFHILFLPSMLNRTKLYVSLCGGGRKGKEYPLFLRWKYRNFLDGHYICIDDPMYEFDTNNRSVSWYYGNKDIFYLYEMVEIIKKIQKQLFIDDNNTIFFGSSGGGTAAIHMANFIDYTTAYAMNPQYYLATWNKNVTKHFMKNGIDLRCNDDVYGRNILELKNNKSFYFLLHNLNSKVDREQIIPFLKRYNLSLKYGLHVHGNIITWMHCTEYKKVHSANFPKHSFTILNYLRECLINGYDILEFYNFSILFNEMLNTYFKQLNVIEEYKLFRNEIIDNLSNHILTHYPMLSKKQYKNGCDFILYDRNDIFFRLRKGENFIGLYIVSNNTESKIYNILNSLFPDNELIEKNNQKYYRFILDFAKNVEIYCDTIIDKSLKWVCKISL